MAAASVQVSPSPHIGLSQTSTASAVMDNKSTVQQEANAQDSKSKTSSPAQTKTSLPESRNTSQAEDSKTTTQTATEPLAPPPRPPQTSTAETPDYFSSVHNGASNISSEFNPFEQSFGVPSAETPGGTRLPPVAALTSPAIPGANSNNYNFPGSLRSGPLSPAMLEGPQGDYFGNISSRGFPTPNESSLRTGLTPGGGGSMFPAPSPNSQALFNQLASGGATPGTLDFHRTAMNAAARSKGSQYPVTTGAQEQPNSTAMDAQHDATDAANGLFMLAKGGQANQFAVPNAPSQPSSTRGQDLKRNARNNGSIGSASGGDVNDADSQDDSKPTTRGAKGKKNTKVDTTTTARRKSEATQKGPIKKSKGNNGNANVDPALEDHDDDDDDDDMSDMDEDGKDPNQKDPKKMTDEEKRRNFLERNRVAALKCRQRKKQWLANLQHKVEMYSAENDSLNTQVAQLHDEIRSLRTLLMGHKDCPVGHAQGIGQFLSGMQDPSGFSNHQVHPYGMAMSNGAGLQPGMQRT